MSRELKLAQIAAIYRKSLYHFCKYGLGMKDINMRTHGGVIRGLESQATRHLIVLPRGALKSSLAVTGYCIWRLIKNPNDRILIDSEVYENSKNFIREIKAYMQSQHLIDVFGDFKGEIWSEGEITIRQRNKPYKEASVTAGGVNTVKVGQHYSCLLGGTLILTSKGFLKIEDITVGHRVYGIDGKYHSVIATKATQNSSLKIGLKAKYQQTTNWVTSEHRVYIFRDNAFQWIEAKDIKKTDMFAIPIPTGNTRQLSKVDSKLNELAAITDIWWLIGRWLADGARTPDGDQIRMTIGAHKKECIEEIKRIVTDILRVSVGSNETESSTVMITFSHKQMKELLAKFGDYAYNKRLPSFATNAGYNQQWQLLKGYIQGDGCFQGTHTVAISSTSFDLLSGIQLLGTRLGIPFSFVSYKKAQKGVMVCGNSVNTRESWSICASHPYLALLLGKSASIPTQPLRSFFTDKFWVVPVDDLKTKESIEIVYDIQVAEVESFYSPGMIFHNCIVSDDLNSGNNSGTPEARAKVLQHYRLNDAILDPGGTYVVIGTRYSDDDVIGNILKNEIGIK